MLDRETLVVRKKQLQTEANNFRGQLAEIEKRIPELNAAMHQRLGAIAVLDELLKEQASVEEAKA